MKTNRWSSLLQATVVAGMLHAGLIQAQTTNIAGLFATGAGGTPGLPDLHYSLISEPAGSPTAALIAIIPNPSWVPAPAGSAWLSPVVNGHVGLPNGDYVYRLTFNLVDSGGHALDPNTASMFLQFASDDYVTVLLNGVAIAAAPTVVGETGFGQIFSAFANTGFVAGVNTLDFDVYNFACPTSPSGVLVSDFCTSAEILQTGNVPEPSTWALLGISLMAVILYRRSKSVPALVPVRINRNQK